MDNHPIPQDITGFQFKLIGNMTVRQFGYLAAGVILAWASYILPIPFLLKLPLIIFFVSFGVSFAFIPVEGRPMDTMFINLIKALFSPTQYLYKKDGGELLKPNYIATQQNPVFQQAPPQPIAAVQSPVPVQINQPPAPPPGPEEQKIEEQLLEQQEEVLVEEVKEVGLANPNDQKLLELQAMLGETVKQKQELEKELLSLKAALQTQVEEQPILKPKIEPKKETPPIPQPVQSSEPPNLIMGSVKDPRGNPVSNILVEVLDQEENPVRAFKTNEKGNFTSATSLPNGKYVIKLEDSKEEHRFDPIPFEATGSPLPNFEIKSIDQREELRRELFN